MIKMDEYGEHDNSDIDWSTLLIEKRNYEYDLR
jgi:hypothetical protein